jgi:hypothetical protein
MMKITEGEREQDDENNWRGKGTGWWK